MMAITDGEFRQLSAYIQTNYGIHLKAEKKALVIGRLQGVLLQLECDSFTEYLQYVISDMTGEAASTLIDKISTNHTFFMREAAHFQFFKQRVLPQITDAIKEKDLRIWSAGCSTGEEPYTLAMILDEYFGSDKGAWERKVLATDISNRVLEFAKKGVYHAEATASLPKSWLHRYFIQTGENLMEVDPSIRNEVIFRRFNLMDRLFPFKRKFHAIFCRNVMIYFDHQTRTDLVKKYYDCLEPGGYLFIGHSETLQRENNNFDYIMPAVYRKV